MDDCRNCQTSTATLAEPGDLSWRLAGSVNCGATRTFVLNDSESLKRSAAYGSAAYGT